jgi:integral membrane protein (TIGR01906 family)
MVMMKTGYERFYRVFQRVLIGFGALILVLGLLIWTQFDRVFIIFHHIVFDNSAWLFDPRTDLMINMLPEGLFMDFAVRILVVFALMLTAVEVGFVWIRKQIKKKMQV